LTDSNGETRGDISEREWRRFVHEYRAACRARIDISPAVKLIIDEVLDHFGTNETACPGVRRLMQRTGMRSSTTITRAVETAIEKGILIRDRAGRGVRSTYRIPPDVLATMPKRTDPCGAFDRSERTDLRDTSESEKRTDPCDTPQAEAHRSCAPKRTDPARKAHRSA